jgi:hypothetical protein
MLIILANGCLTKRIISSECIWYKPIHPHLTIQEINTLNDNAINVIKYNDQMNLELCK